MDDREGGFIKLHRRIRSWPLWQSMTAPEQRVWIELLLCANWKDGEFWYGSHRIPVLRGQLAHSEAEIAKLAKVGRKVVRAAIAKLQTEGAIGREKAPLEGQAPHVITIRNYEKYQGYDDGEGPAEGQGRAKAGPSEGQGRALREEGEEGEEGNTSPFSSPPVRSRKARLGVLHPAFEAIEHWTHTVWPRLSKASCPDVTTAQAQRLADLCGRHGTPEVTAAMDQAASDQWWASKLDLGAFLCNFGKFLLRGAGGDAAVKQHQVVGSPEWRAAHPDLAADLDKRKVKP